MCCGDGSFVVLSGKTVFFVSGARFWGGYLRGEARIEGGGSSREKAQL